MFKQVTLSHGEIVVVVRTVVVVGSVIVDVVAEVAVSVDSIPEVVVGVVLVVNDVAGDGVVVDGFESVVEVAVSGVFVEEDIVDKVVVIAAFVVIVPIPVAVVNDAAVEPSACSVLSAFPLLLLLRKIGTLKIEQSAPNKTATVRKSKNFRDLLSMVFKCLTKRRRSFEELSKKAN